MSVSLLSAVVSALRLPAASALQRAALSTLTSTPSGAVAGGSWSTLSVRTNIRNHFPRAREGKRVKVYGWLKRMSTVAGRRVLMRRILKGRHVLSH